MNKNPLNGKGNATIIAAPVVFTLAEALFHAHPVVGGAVAVLSGAIAYRHYDDVSIGVERLKGGMLRDYSPIRQSVYNEQSEKEVEEKSSPSTQVDIRDIPIPIGAGRDGRRFERTLRQLKGILILGLQEGGKTNTAIHLIRHFVKNGAHLAIIDKHARSEEDSMTSKIKPLEGRFDCPVGYNPDTALKVIGHVRAIFDERLEGGKCDYPLFLVVDEFTSIMRQTKGGKWQAVATALEDLVSDINSEGRKHQVFALCIGQIANASSTGGTEIRELFATRIVHAMSWKQANILGLTEINKQVERLGKGEVFFQTEGFNAFWLKIPYVEASAIKRLASTLPAIERVSRDEIDEEVFNGFQGLPGRTSTQNVSFQAQNSNFSREVEAEVLPGSDTTSVLRSIAKRVRSGESLASIRREYGLPGDGRACQEVNESLRWLGENILDEEETDD